MDQVNEPDEVVADVTWTEPGFGAWLRKSFARAPRVLRGTLVASRTGLTLNAEGVHGALLRWPWVEVADLRTESGVADYLILDVKGRPARRPFALTESDAASMVERMRLLATANGWSPSTGPSHEGPREQRLAANTARFIHRFPDAYVIRVAAAADARTRATMAVGLAFASVARYGHLVADGDGLRLYLTANEADWDKPWREITALELTGDERALKLDAVGWQLPKHYAPCEPNGDVLLPFAVKGVLAQLRAWRGVR